MTERRTLRVRVARILGAILLATVAGLASAPFLLSGHAFREIDWNADGRISPGEFLGAGDVGRRTVLENGRECTEFFAFKDGMPIRIDCAHDP